MKKIKKEIKWVEELTWEEFKNSGLLWFVNNTLHLFGRAIVFEYTKNKKIKRVYFARCRFRGFSEKCINKGFNNLTNFLSKNIKELKRDIKL